MNDKTVVKLCRELEAKIDEVSAAAGEIDARLEIKSLGMWPGVYAVRVQRTKIETVFEGEAFDLTEDECP